MGLIDGFLEGKANQRRGKLEATHPTYQANIRTWQIGLDAYDATGGFLNGAYLWRFAREAADQYQARRNQSRYHNYAETLVDIYVRHVTSGVVRETSNERLADWWNDVDGAGTEMTDYMASALGQALAAGHAGVLIDKSAEEAGVTQAEDTAPFVRTFTAPDIRDWRLDGQGLAAVKLAEDAPVVDLSDDSDPDKGFLLWDRERWARFTAKGVFVTMGEHALEAVPLVVIRPKRSRRQPFIGKALVSPQLIQAHYNRASEEDLVLRDQAFSLFLIQVPSDATEEEVKLVEDKLSSGVGTTTAIVTKGTGQFETADMQVPKTIRETQAALIHEMYRMAHLRFQRDTLETESAEALRLQRQDLDQALQSIAEEMTRAEELLAWLYFAWTTPDADRAFEAADVSIQYPKEFSLVNLEQELTAIGLATEALRASPTATQELRKKALTIALPDLSDETLETVRQELENAPQGLGAGAQSLRDQAAARLQEAGVEIEAA